VEDLHAALRSRKCQQVGPGEAAGRAGGVQVPQRRDRAGGVGELRQRAVARERLFPERGVQESDDDVSGGEQGAGAVLYDAGGEFPIAFLRLEMRGVTLIARGVGQKFLKALGYLSTFDRPPDVDEQIQMHADTLYHRMLEQEKAIQGAKAAGLPVPQFPPIVPSMSTAAPATAAYTQAAETLPEEDRITLDKLRPSIQAKLKKRLKGLNADQKELEEKAINAEIEAGDKLARDVTTLFEQQAQSRKERREQGKDTWTDKISGVFGW